MIKKVLLIDDDTDDAEIFKEALAEADSTIVFNAIDDGREALDELKQPETKLPGIIFLDINMPAISGWQCLKELKETDRLKDIPVVMYSTSSHQREKDIAEKNGAAAFFTKPHNFNELKEKIEELVDKFYP